MRLAAHLRTVTELAAVGTWDALNGWKDIFHALTVHYGERNTDHL